MNLNGLKLCQKMKPLLDGFKMSMYDVAKKNGWHYSDEETERRIKSGEYQLIHIYGKDENLLVYVPYIPVIITPLNDGKA